MRNNITCQAYFKKQFEHFTYQRNGHTLCLTDMEGYGNLNDIIK